MSGFVPVPFLLATSVRIEQELRALSFTEVEEARMFELALRERVRTIVPMNGNGLPA